MKPAGEYKFMVVQTNHEMINHLLLMQAHAIDPCDATLLANLSLCWLKLREGKQAALDAQGCQMLRPRWAKPWFREGAALSLLQVCISSSQ
jgi:hypothetical protein